MNTTRPENHVLVPLILETDLTIICYSGTRLCLMAPCPSITITLYILESLSLLTDVSVLLSSIPVTRTTNKEYTRHILLILGSCESLISLMSSSQKYVYFPP